MTLQILLLAAHLLCVNVASGGPIVGAWLDWRGTRGDDIAAKAAAFLARASLLALLVGAVLGLVVAGLQWSADYRSLWLGPLSYKMHWAIVEAIFSLVLMILWWLWLPARAGGRNAPMLGRGLIALLAATNLLYHFPLLFSVAGQLVDSGQTSGPVIRGAEFRRLMLEAHAPALAIHVALASIAVAAALLLLLAERALRQRQDDTASRLARWGGRWALVPSLLQLPVGLWALLTLPAGDQSRLLGGSAAGTLLFVASLATALWLINELVHIAAGELNRSILTRAIVALLLTVTLMTAMQQQARPPIQTSSTAMTPHLATIHDPASGASAEILVSQGFNCFRFTAMPAGQPVEVLYSPAELATGQGRPSRGGIPLMFPFPGRIPGTTFTWEGKPYQLEPGDAFGNAIHGFAMWRAWRVIEQSENAIVGQFHAWSDDPSLQQRWPADFRLTARYELKANSLNAEYTIENPGETPLPCGFGTHPYFRVPVGGPKADDCVVRLPVAARWELKDMLPTGNRLDLPNAAAFQAGQRYGDLKLDDAFTRLNFDGGWSSASIHDPASGRTVMQRCDQAFRECVVFTPPHREAICIEPLTCVPSCFDLTARGIDAGLRIVQPGSSFRAKVEIRVTESKRYDDVPLGN